MIVSSPSGRLVVLLYRLGFGWLVGRWWLVAVTTTSAGTRATVHRYRLDAGTVVVPVTPGPWLDDLAAKPLATVHAAPGPLAVTAEFAVDEVVFSPTGRNAPAAIVPDLNWVLPVTGAAVGVAMLGRRLARRRGRLGQR